LPELTTEVERLSLVIEIGGMPVRVNTTDPGFVTMLQDRYAGYVLEANASEPGHAEIEFDVDLVVPTGGPDEDVRVTRSPDYWTVTRGDFHAEWSPSTRRGRIRQSANPYSIDAVLRITHTLVLARQGGFLMHSASAIRNGRAFLFSGVSGAGKTTISRLAPPDATLLTDEISYVRKRGDGYVAYGTPFTWRKGPRIASTKSRPAKPRDLFLPICSFSRKMKNSCRPHFIPRSNSPAACRFAGSRSCPMCACGR
jgi:hypothetical protein